MTRRLVLACALACACRELPQVTHEGQHIRVAVDPGLELCAGSMAHMDEFVARLSAELGLEVPTGDERPLAYWLERDGFVARTPCPERVVGCARDGVLFTNYMPYNHEFVHTVAHPLGRSLPFFNEGLAVAYGGLGAEIDANETALLGPVEPLLRLPDGTDLGAVDGGYPRAGAFVAFLIETHGIDAYLRALDDIGRGADVGDIDRAFLGAFDASLASLVAEFDIASNRCAHPAYDAKLIECAAPELAWSDGRIAEHRPIACDQPDAVGPYGGNVVVVFRTVTIAEPGDYIVELFGDSTANKLALRSCGRCGSEPTLALRAGDPATTVWLDLGRHTLRLFGSVDQRTSLGLRITPATTP
ncbi:hypothetical protein [Nannocystis radixulma]|uniref:Uncharacterized protein n=1 Tax=Nannocystis radixulma TaxID=2995305 RepID=A0ABT5BCM1_9BACT|nr:hypothetical protein [Nannocystis radixulma]MDC0671861.1 hypothetical protein [Nannocystis radixulma]